MTNVLFIPKIVAMIESVFMGTYVQIIQNVGIWDKKNAGSHLVSTITTILLHTQAYHVYIKILIIS